jgi:hypothetical protein
MGTLAGGLQAAYHGRDRPEAITKRDAQDRILYLHRDQKLRSRLDRLDLAGCRGKYAGVALEGAVSQ